jgi:hypothetical protein
MGSMPFGKYKGRPLQDLPASYLRWVLRECDLRPWLEDAIRRVLAGTDRQREWRREPEPGVDVPEDLIARWYRTLVMKWHPDRGGSTEAMQAVNDARELLVELLDEQVVRA